MSPNPSVSIHQLHIGQGPHAIHDELVDGTAEVNGCELPPDVEYVFKESKSCVFTWDGCRICIEGQCEAYVANDTPMTFYLNVHHVLQSLREMAHRHTEKTSTNHGPRVLVFAPTDSGKSTLCNILVNYGARAGEKMTFVELDVGQNSLTIPGTLAAIVVDKPQLFPDTWGQGIPIVYFYGSTTPGDNQKLYITQMENLANTLKQRDMLDPSAHAAGWIVNTCGWVDGPGLKLVHHAINIMQPNVILVIAYDKLYYSLLMHIKDTPALKHVQIVKLPKSGGVVIRDTEWRKSSRDAKLREYFYGYHREYLPRNIVIPFNKVSIYRLDAKPLAPMSAMPIGHEVQEETLRVIPANPCQHAILAVSRAETQEDIISANAAGFLRVVEVNQEKKSMRCLAPNLDDLPGKFLIMSNIKFTDSSS